MLSVVNKSNLATPSSPPQPHTHTHSSPSTNKCLACVLIHVSTTKQNSPSKKMATFILCYLLPLLCLIDTTFPALQSLGFCSRKSQKQLLFFDSVTQLSFLLQKKYPPPPPPPPLLISLSRENLFLVVRRKTGFGYEKLFQVLCFSHPVAFLSAA